MPTIYDGNRQTWYYHRPGRCLPRTCLEDHWVVRTPKTQWWPLILTDSILTWNKINRGVKKELNQYRLVEIWSQVWWIVRCSWSTLVRFQRVSHVFDEYVPFYCWTSQAGRIPEQSDSGWHPVCRLWEDDTFMTCMAHRHASRSDRKLVET